MIMIEIRLPDELARQAREAGLLSDAAIQELIEDAMRRRAGRALLGVARDLRDADSPPMSDADVVAEVHAVRAERRARAIAANVHRAMPDHDAGGS
jgi:hypothetical protein